MVITLLYWFYCLDDLVMEINQCFIQSLATTLKIKKSLRTSSYNPGRMVIL